MESISLENKREVEVLRDVALPFEPIQGSNPNVVQKKSKVRKMDGFRAVLTTRKGIWALWDVDTYRHIASSQEWEENFGNSSRMEKQILNQTFAPINIRQGGTLDFCIKVNQELNQREKKYLVIASNPYLIQTSGRIKLSGIEFIGKEAQEAMELVLPQGEYEVKICMIEWTKEEGVVTADGSKHADALADFVILLKESNGDVLRRNYNIVTYKG